MTSGDAEEEPWRQPDPDAAGEGPDASQRYPGPPSATPPPADWRPPRAVLPAQPRRLPVLDDEAIDQAEHRAEYVTYAIGLAAGVVLLILALIRHLG